jgi:hypothetical protein
LLHHVSFNARDPERVAGVLAELLGAQALRAPAPPFPKAAWFVCCGDEVGTLVEVMPWGETRDASSPRGVSFDADMRETSGAHVLMSTPHRADHIFTLAEREDWRVENADAGLFKFIKVWVENTFLVELMTPEMTRAYVAAFGAAASHEIDGKLRALEQTIAAAMQRVSEPAS